MEIKSWLGNVKVNLPSIHAKVPSPLKAWFHNYRPVCGQSVKRKKVLNDTLMAKNILQAKNTAAARYSEIILSVQMLVPDK